MLIIDPASTTKKCSDYTAFVVGSTGKDIPIKYIRKGEILKLEFDAYLDHAIELLIKYVDIAHVCIERNTYSKADILKIKEKIKDIPELDLRRINFINDPQRDNKFDKIEVIVGDVNFGRIIFNEEDINAIQQLADYKGKRSIHHDFPDCLAEFCKKIKNTNNINMQLLWILIIYLKDKEGDYNICLIWK